MVGSSEPIAQEPYESSVELYAAIVGFEADAPKGVGAKEDAIRKTFGISPIRYYQILNLAIDHPKIMAEHPTLTKRLQRIRNRRSDTYR